MVIDSWLWGIEPAHFRVWFALLALASPVAMVYRSPLWGAVEVPAGGLVTSLDRLAERVGVSRAVVRGALARLAGGPLKDGTEPAIVVAANPRGYTLITVVVPGLDAGSAQPTSTAIAPAAAQHQHGEQHREQHSAGSTSTATSLASSTGPTGETSSSRIDLPASTRPDQHSEAHSTQPGLPLATQPDQLGTAGALSDPRSGDLRSDRKDPPTSAAGASADDDADVEDDDKASRKAAKIPPWAWNGADYLRTKLLEAEPENIVRTKPWGPEVKRGWRLTWADAIRLMVDVDKRRQNDIRTAIDWLYSGQGGTEPQFRIVVASADALRTKWDQIARAITRRAAPAPRPANAPPTAYVDPPKKKEWK